MRCETLPINQIPEPLIPRDQDSLHLIGRIQNVRVDAIRLDLRHVGDIVAVITQAQDERPVNV